MIAMLTGRLTKKSPEQLIIDVGGVGYRVLAPISTYCALPETGKTVTLNIHTHIREDAFRLFGFLTERELFLFEKLITISKIGPKLAINILSGIPAAELEAAVERSDTGKLASIPGVGKKTAERMAMELKDKLKGLPALGPHGAGMEGYSPGDNLLNDALSALMNLGFQKDKAEKAVLRVYNGTEGKNRSVEDIIRESLKILV